MFVQSNKVSELKHYFKKKLELQFSTSELKFLFNVCLEKRLHLSKSEILFSDEILLSESDLLFFKEVIHKLQENIPFQHIIGETEFYGLKIKCDERALIPRPETEELVHWIYESFTDRSLNLKLADFCTGSACIALALASVFPKSKIQAVDVSKVALDLAQENAILNSLEIELLEIDLLNELTSKQFAPENLDCIVSNPPYIPNQDKEEMHENVLKHEPHLALFVADENPIVFYKKIAQIAKSALKNGGLLFFEIHEKFAEEVVEYLQKLNFRNIEIKKDLQGKDRMIKAMK